MTDNVTPYTAEALLLAMKEAKNSRPSKIGLQWVEERAAELTRAMPEREVDTFVPLNGAMICCCAGTGQYVTLADYRTLSADHARLGEELSRVAKFSGNCGLSTDGINVFGNNESIKRVTAWMHEAQAMPQVKKHLWDEIDSLKAERDRLTAQLSAQSGLHAEVDLAIKCLSASQWYQRGFQDAESLMNVLSRISAALRPTSPAVSDEQGEGT